MVKVKHAPVLSENEKRELEKDQRRRLLQTLSQAKNRAAKRLEVDGQEKESADHWKSSYWTLDHYQDGNAFFPSPSSSQSAAARCETFPDLL